MIPVPDKTFFAGVNLPLLLTERLSHYFLSYHIVISLICSYGLLTRIKVHTNKTKEKYLECPTTWQGQTTIPVNQCYGILIFENIAKMEDK